MLNKARKGICQLITDQNRILQLSSKQNLKKIYNMNARPNVYIGKR